MKIASYTRALLATIAAALVLAFVHGPSVAQQDTKWLFGKWGGEQWSGSGPSHDRTRVEVVFRDQSGNIEWELEIVSTIGRGFGSKAVGTATLSGESLSIQGKYIAGEATGASLSYSLQRKGENELAGTGLGRTQAVFNVAWKKIQ